MTGWFVVQTLPRQEYRVERELKRHGFQTWLPECRVKRRGRRAIEVVNEPLFPGYEFLQPHQAHEYWWCSLVDLTQPVVLLSSLAGPLMVPDGEIHQVREIVERYHDLIVVDGRAQALGLQAGAEIAVVSGLFAGWRGIFQCYERDGRVKILLDMLGSARVVALTEASIAAVPSTIGEWQHR